MLGITIYTLLAPAPIPISMANGVQAHALHINGTSPYTDQQCTYLMTYSLCFRVHDIKGIIKYILFCVSDNPVAAYDALQFSKVNLAGGEWRNLLIRLRIDSAAHVRLHGALLYQLDTFTYVARFDTDTTDIIPWFEPLTTPHPLLTNSNSR